MRTPESTPPATPLTPCGAAWAAGGRQAGAAGDKERLRARWAPVWHPELPLPPWWDPAAAAPPRDLPPARRPRELSAEQHAKLAELRSSLAQAAAPLPAAPDGDDELLRYLTARKWDVEAARAQLLATLQWRGERAAQSAGECVLCSADPTAHCMALAGWDPVARPVLYSGYRFGRDRAPDSQLEHALCALDFAVTAMPPGVGQLVIVVDFDGFGPSDASPLLAQRMARLLQSHYPERMGLVILVEPPWVFDLVLRALGAILSERTMSKVRTVGGGGAPIAPEAFGEFFDPGMCEWLAAAAAESRRLGRAPPQ
eukprot:TRINITY_DN60_c0_g3_i2.p1 TRINITY_DN60_c0_g3~~TRINITY_DN60_c0_g3_i2.p1  ORF type:complete len:313 (+),score=85.63 TRINITY_DN60_c0_g3_i2:716-1654(+)